MFLVLCEFVEDFIHDQDIAEFHTDANDFKFEIPGFHKYYEINDNPTSRNLLISLYFAFTSLSTVGFGDYYPVSSFEHLSGSVLLLAGVAT